MSDIKYSGPLFDSADMILSIWGDELAAEMGRDGLAEISKIMDQSFKNPTPYYETQVMYEPFNGGGMIHDRGIVYGPWLEGVSARNATSRFKGYHMFRRTKQYLQERPATLERLERILIDRLGG